MRRRIRRPFLVVAAILAVSLSCLVFSSARALDYASQFLDTYYRVQDDVLFPTEIGRHYIDLHYRYSNEIWQLSLAHEEIMSQAGRLLLEFEPPLHELVEGRGHQVLVTQDMVNRVEGFLDLLVQFGSPELQATIQSERDRAPLVDLVGLSFDQAQLQRLGPPQPDPPGTPPTRIPIPFSE
ncbi:MAG TPA: hypothetical protein VJK02_20685 [Anaerolineales bacterium]|nr:hypothetical protein [Anaerolineales bacterium]